MIRPFAFVLGFLTSSSAILAVENPDPPPATAPPSKALPIPGEVLSVAGHAAFLLLPAEKLRRTPQPWIWYAPTLPGLPDTHEKWMHEQFLAAGVAVAGIDVGESYGSPAGRQGFTALYDELTSKRGFAKKPCLLGRSRGGLMIASWASANPDKLSGIAGIYPVFDFCSYPGLDKAAPAYQLSATTLAAQSAELNPVKRFAILAKAKVPIFLIHGDSDKVVPLEANSGAAAAAYKAAGASELLQLIVPSGQGHNLWEGFFRCQELIAFAIKQATAH